MAIKVVIKSAVAEELRAFLSIPPLLNDGATAPFDKIKIN
jgi:hypothetical protein